MISPLSALLAEWDWTEAEWLVANVDALYRELAGDKRSLLPLAQPACHAMSSR